jgi:ligand-binding sensor domain-containing protein/two-component sensor histidine kinase
MNRSYMRKYLGIYFILLAPFLLRSQDLTEYFKTLNNASGLPSNLVFCLYKDHRSFLWLGTNNGLSRFDGKHIVTYSRHLNDSSSLVNNTVNSITEDDHGRIWLATDGGISVLDVHTNKFTTIRWVKEGPNVRRLNDKVISIAYYRNRIYAGLRDGILSTPTDSIAFTRCTDADLHYTKRIQCLPNRAFATAKGLWIATMAGMFYSEDGIGFANKQHNPKRWQIFNLGTVFTFCSDGDSACYFTNWTYEGIYRFHYAKNRLDSFAFRGLPNLLAIGKTGPHEIWGGTFTRGVVVLDLKTGTRRFQGEDGAENKIQNEIMVNQILKDDEGTVFAGTFSGLYYINPVQTQFRFFHTRLDDRHTFPPTVPYAIQMDDSGKIWCGSFYDGLYSHDPKSKRTTRHELSGNYNRVMSICNAGNKLLIGSLEGVATFDLKSGKMTPVRLPLSVTRNGHTGVTFVQHIANNEYWIGMSQNGLIRMDIGTGDFRHFSMDDSVFRLGSATPSAHLVKNGKLWLGFHDKDLISKIDPATNKVTDYKIGRNGKTYGGIRPLVPDKEGNIWAGSWQGGVICLDTNGRIVREYTTEDGLTNNYIAFLKFDNAGKLWIGTSNGLNKLDPTTGKIVTFTYSDGLASNQCMDKMVVMDRAGIMYMVIDKYLVHFDPERLHSNPTLPKVRILNIQKSGVDYTYQSEKDVVNLDYNDKILAVDYTAINYIDPDKTQYAYQLEGFDNNWTYSGNRNYVSYTNLPPGDYALKLKATNQAGSWNVPELAIRLHVSGPFWKTWWFYTLCLMLTFLLAYLIYYVRLQQILKIQAIRDKISKDLHDDIGSALSSIAIYSEVAKKYSEAKVPEVTSILNSLQETAKEAMENMSDIVWSINPLHDRFAETVRRLEIFANGILSARGISPSFSVDDSINQHKLSMQQRKNLYLICKEAINNVAKYSEAKSCSVQISDDGGKITISIKDDGVGIAENRQKLGGNGIINMKKRAQELKGILDIISNRNNGTLLSLKFVL